MCSWKVPQPFVSFVSPPIGLQVFDINLDVLGFLADTAASASADEDLENSSLSDNAEPPPLSCC